MELSACCVQDRAVNVNVLVNLGMTANVRAVNVLVVEL